MEKVASVVMCPLGYELYSRGASCDLCKPAIDIDTLLELIVDSSAKVDITRACYSPISL